MASRLARHVDATNLATRHYEKGFSCLWLPAWLHLPFTVFRSNHCDGDMQRPANGTPRSRPSTTPRRAGGFEGVMADVARAAAWEVPAAWMYVELPGAPRWAGREVIEIDDMDEASDESLAPSFDRFTVVCQCIR